MNDGLKVLGNLTVTLIDKNGNIKEEHNFKNLVVNTGLLYLTHSLSNTSNGATFNYIALGTGTSSPSAANTTLQVEIARQSVGAGAFDYNYWNVQTTFAAGTGTGTITEAGIFNATSGGTMLSRTTFTPIVKHASDSLTVSWTINFASA